MMREGLAALARRAYKNARERTPMLKGLLRIRRYHQQETPYALQEADVRSWLRIGEAYSALRGLAPHSGRSSVPFPRALFRDRRSSLPTIRPRQHTGVSPNRPKLP